MADFIPILTVAFFTLILIYIGYYYRDRRSPEKFFMAHRDVKWVRILSSTFSILGAGEIVTLTAFVYIFGFWGMTLFSGFFLGAITVAFLSSKIRRKSEEYKPYTITDYMNFSFGSKSEKISILLSLLAIGSLLLIQLVVGGQLLATLTGLSYNLSVIIVGLIITIYLTLGGLNSVLTTDVIQAVSALILVSLILIIFDPGASLSQIFAETTSNVSWKSFPVLLISGFFAILCGADVHQRIFAASSDEELRKGMIGTGIAFLAFGILLLLVGLKISFMFPDANPNNAFFEFLNSGLSQTMLALLALFVTANIFSAADTELFLSSILVGKFFGSGKELETKSGIKLVWIIVTLTILLSVFFQSLVNIYFILLYAFMILGPPMLATLFERGTDLTASVGMILSLALLVILGFIGKLDGLYPLLLLIPASAPLFVKNK